MREEEFKQHNALEFTICCARLTSAQLMGGLPVSRAIREFGNRKNIIAYIIVFVAKYMLLHLICLFKYSCFFQTYP